MMGSVVTRYGLFAVLWYHAELPWGLFAVIIGMGAAVNLVIHIIKGDLFK